MHDRCHQFEQQMTRDGSAMSPAAWRGHLEGCAICRQQARIDLALKGAFRSPAPQLDFDALLARSAAARRPAPLSAKARMGIALYGCLAALVALVILVRLPWASATANVLIVAVCAGVLTLAVLLLDRAGQTWTEQQD